MHHKPRIHSPHGLTCLRIYLLASFLTQSPLTVTNLPSSPPPHLANLLKLTSIITSGSEIRLRNGTLKMKPGIVTGEKYLEHEVAKSRGVSYWVEYALILLLFTKRDSVIRFMDCVTNDSCDPSVDALRLGTLPLVKRFLDRNPEQLRLEIVKRGNMPRGGGEVILYVPFLKNHLKAQQMTEFGMIKRVRGIAFASRMDPLVVNRMMESSKEEIQRVLHDVWINTDYCGKKDSGPDSGYSLYLQAETDRDCLLATEYTAQQGAVPEEVGKHTAHCLFDMLKVGSSCVDRMRQWIVLFLMSLTPDDVNKVRISKLSKYSIFVLRIIREAIGVEFMFEEQDDSVVCICVGSNKRNLTRKSS